MNIVAEHRYLPSVKELVKMISTFALTTFAWIFFRAENITHAFNYISEMFSKTLFTYPAYENDDANKILFILLIIFILIEWLGRKGQYAISGIDVFERRIFRWGIYLSIGLLIFIFQGEQQEFIYFQF